MSVPCLRLQKTMFYLLYIYNVWNIERYLSLLCLASSPSIIMTPFSTTPYIFLLLPPSHATSCCTLQLFLSWNSAWVFLINNQHHRPQLLAVSIAAAKAQDDTCTQTQTQTHTHRHTHRHTHTHTHTHTHPSSSGFLRAEGWFGVLCMFLDEHSSSNRLIGQGFSFLLNWYFLLLISLIVMFLP